MAAAPAAQARSTRAETPDVCCPSASWGDFIPAAPASRAAGEVNGRGGWSLRLLGTQPGGLPCPLSRCLGRQEAAAGLQPSPLSSSGSSVQFAWSLEGPEDLGRPQALWKGRKGSLDWRGPGGLGLLEEGTLGRWQDEGRPGTPHARAQAPGGVP